MSETVQVQWDSAGTGAFGTDISGYVMNIKTNRGRKTDLGRMPPGMATLTLNNHDGRFSPDKADGPHHGDLEMYRRVRIKGTVDGAGTYGAFYGFVLGMDNKPRMNQQIVTWTLGDRFALWQHMMLNLPLMRNCPVKAALDLAVNRAMGDNECDNSSVEIDLDDYSGLQGVTPVRLPYWRIEGDYSVVSNCPGDNAGEGWRFDATGDVTVGKPIIARVWAEAVWPVDLKFRAFDSVHGELVSSVVSVGETPTLLEIAVYVADLFRGGSSHYFDLITNGAGNVIFWSDGLYFITPSTLGEISLRDLDDGTAEIELAAAYRQPALEVIQAIAESEPRSFFFPYIDNTNYLERLRFWDKDHRAVGSSETFSDDGADVPYHDLFFAEHAIDRISECELTSQGDYEDENKRGTIWELSPTPVTIPATETMVFHAFYSQPVRNCLLSVNPDGSGASYPVALSGDDGYIHRWENAHPPDANDEVDDSIHHLWVGQRKYGATYHVYRSYVRFDTSGIDDGATILSATLRLKVRADTSDTDFGIDVRDCAQGAVLAVGDWDGTDTIRGSIETSTFPPAGEWIEIDIAVAGVDKTAHTEFEIMSDNEGVAPTETEDVFFSSYDDDPDFAPQLIVVIQGAAPDSEAIENYGVGAKITIGAGAEDLAIDVCRITGIPLRGSMEESKVVEASAAPPAIERTLKYALPLQGTRTASMITEANRLADRYDGRIKRCSMLLKAKNDVVLTQMLAREIGEKIHVENTKHNFSTHIDGDFWILGIDHDIQISKHTVVHETTFHLEEA